MTGTVLLIIFATFIGLIRDVYTPTEYELSMEDGTSTHVVLQKHSIYACPIYCDVDHTHHAVMFDYNSQIEGNEFIYHILDKNDKGISFYCSTKKIVSMNKRPAKDELPDVASASIDE